METTILISNICIGTFSSFLKSEKFNKLECMDLKEVDKDKLGLDCSLN